MSKVYVMQEFPNRTNACQKVHLKRSFGCITQAIVLSSNSSSGLWEVISPEITIAIGLQLLGLGASYIILTSAYGVSASSVFVARSLSVNAANLGQELKVATNRLHIEIKHPQGKRVGVPPIHITLDIFLAMA